MSDMPTLPSEVDARRVFFLHIPKTAGQSVHAALVNAYGADAVCPARVNEQLVRLGVRELNRYRVFSGHLDWSLLDCVRGPRYVFTVLREPRDRILSFYFYLREQAAKLSGEDLHKPQHQGMKAVLELSPDDYFCGGPPHLRRFLDDHYDNFYTYYFAGRHYRGRQSLAGQVQQKLLSREQLIELALDNLGTLDAVFRVDDMGRVFGAIRALSGASIRGDEAYRVNVNAAVAAGERAERLKALGASTRTFERLKQWCTMDELLWQRAFPAAQSPPSALLVESAP